MPTCVPVRDMKNTAAFASLVERAETPVTVTRNGYDAFVVMKSSAYEALQEELAKMRLLSRISQAEAEYASGEHVDYTEFSESLREKHGL